VSDPLALLPARPRRGSGRIGAAGADLFDAQQLVAAGLTLLQRSAPLVRALSGKRAAILLPTAPQYLTALAASEGRGAVLVNPLASAVEIEYQCRDANVGAVFTPRPLATRVPAGIPMVCSTTPAIGSRRHGRIARRTSTWARITAVHRGRARRPRARRGGGDRLHVGDARRAARRRAHARQHARQRPVDGGGSGADGGRRRARAAPLLAPVRADGDVRRPLLSGARVRTMDRFNPVRAAELLADGVTEVVGVPAVFHAMLGAIERRGVDLHGSRCASASAAAPSCRASSRIAGPTSPVSSCGRDTV
jgi:hypothetical protein